MRDQPIPDVQSGRDAFSAGATFHGARALLFISFAALSTPPFVYGLLPVFRNVQTGLWWCAALILLLSALLLTRIVDDREPASQTRVHGPDLGLLLPFAGLALLIVGYWHSVHLADLRSLPIDSRYADMLPLMLSGFADLDQWQSPYRPHDVPWTLTNYYLPLTFLPYYLAYKCGLDIRYVNLACFALTSLMLLSLWPRTGSRVRQALFFGHWAATTWAFHAVIDAQQFTRIIHMGPYWLYVTVAYTMIVLQKPYAAAAGLLCALAARETAVFHAIPLGIALLLFERTTARIFLTVIPIGLSLIFLPFFIDNPSFYSGNLAQYASLEWVIENSGGYHFVGLTGLLHRIDMMDYNWFFIGAGSAICLALYLSRARSWNSGRALFLCFCCVNVSASFAAVPWPYLSVPSLLILTVFMLGEFGSGCRSEDGQPRDSQPA